VEERVSCHPFIIIFCTVFFFLLHLLHLLLHLLTFLPLSCACACSSSLFYAHVYTPANVLLNESGHAKLADFGVSSQLGGPQEDQKTPKGTVRTVSWCFCELESLISSSHIFASSRSFPSSSDAQTDSCNVLEVLMFCVLFFPSFTLFFDYFVLTFSHSHTHSHSLTHSLSLTHTLSLVH
jgi:serine/threonine protein kinase